MWACDSRRRGQKNELKDVDELHDDQRTKITWAWPLD